MDPKTILCYGDSNTWGHNPRTLERYGIQERWPGVLRHELARAQPGGKAAAAYQVIEEGLCGRTTVFADPFDVALDGRAYLGPCLRSHRPLDLVILMLGTNDLKTRFSAAAGDIAWGAGLLVDIVQKSLCGRRNGAPAVLLIAPPPIGTPPDPESWLRGAEKSRKFAVEFGRIAELYRCHFLDAGQVIESSAVDGVHLEGAAHAGLGRAVAERVRAILG